MKVARALGLIALAEKIKHLKLADGQKKDLVEFVKSLSGDGWQKASAPATFPQ